MFAQIDNAMLNKRPSKIFGRIVSWALIEGRPLTTKGRWINTLVFAGYRIAQYIPPRPSVEEPIFIVGTGRSGTTVLGTLFAMHKQTVFLNEPKAIWHYAHGSEDIIGSYSMGKSSIRLGLMDATADCKKKLSHVYSMALRVGFSHRIVDKYPELVFRVPFVKALFPKAKFIAILRDGVDTCSSVDSWSKRKGETVGDETHDWWGRDDRKWHLIVDELVPEHADLAPLQTQLKSTINHRDRAAVEWILSMREARKMAEENPEVLAIKYEELCSEPSRVLQVISDHCNLEVDPVFTGYAQTILSAADKYESLELNPELVGPFKKMLSMMGYEASSARVVSRGKHLL